MQGKRITESAYIWVDGTSDESNLRGIEDQVRGRTAEPRAVPRGVHTDHTANQRLEIGLSLLQNILHETVEGDLWADDGVTNFNFHCSHSKDTFCHRKTGEARHGDDTSGSIFTV